MLENFSTFSKKWIVKFLDSSGIGAISIPTGINAYNVTAQNNSISGAQNFVEGAPWIDSVARISSGLLEYTSKLNMFSEIPTLNSTQNPTDALFKSTSISSVSLTGGILTFRTLTINDAGISEHDAIIGVTAKTNGVDYKPYKTIKEILGL